MSLYRKAKPGELVDTKVETKALVDTPHVSTPVSTGNRHRPGYKTEYMRKWRAKQKLAAK